MSEQPERTASERREAINLQSGAALAALKKKAEAYAAFTRGKWEAGDLLNASLLAALEGKPKWPRRQTLERYCDARMAHLVRYQVRPERRS